MQPSSERSVFEEDADECEDEFLENDTSDVEIGTAIPLNGSSLNDPNGEKREWLQTNWWRPNWVYIVLIVMSVVIIGLSVGIGVLTRRRHEIVVTDTPSSQPSLAPSLAPTSIPTLSLVVST